MVPDMAQLGLHRFETFLERPREEFQIVRDKDWDEVFYSAAYGDIHPDANPVLGPSNDCHDQNWILAGSVGDVYLIEFQRSYIQGVESVDSKHVSWKKVRHMDDGELQE